MELPEVPQDDIIDVIEMTRKIEDCINSILKENEFHLGISSLMNASIHCLLGQCKTLDDLMFHRGLFILILDDAIGNIRVQAPPDWEEPPSS